MAIQKYLTPAHIKDMVDSYNKGDLPVLLAARFNMSPATVYIVLNKAGVSCIKNRGNDCLDPVLSEKIITAYKAGESSSDIAIRLDVARKSVYNVLKRNNVSLRGRWA